MKNQTVSRRGRENKPLTFNLRAARGLDLARIRDEIEQSQARDRRRAEMLRMWERRGYVPSATNAPTVRP